MMITDFIRTWITGIAGAAIICALADELTPDGMVKRAQKMICGLVMAIALAGPLLSLDLSNYSLNMAKYRESEAEIAGTAGELTDSLSRKSIQEQCETYILDKAFSLGANVSAVKVTAQWSGDGLWYPTAAEIDGEYDRRLSELMETELGISADEQIWRSYENG